MIISYYELLISPPLLNHDACVGFYCTIFYKYVLSSRNLLSNNSGDQKSITNFT